VGLARGDGHVDALAEVTVPLEVLRRDGLLEPRQVVGHERLRRTDGLLRPVVAVAVDHDPCIVAHDLAGGRDPLGVVLGRAADLELRRGEPLIDRLAEWLGGVLAPLGDVRGRGVGDDLAAPVPAEQPVDRLLGGLPEDVPQRDVDGRERTLDECAAGDVVGAGVEPVGERLDLVGVPALDVRGDDLLDDRCGRARRGERLAPAHRAVGRLDADQRRAPGAGQPPCVAERPAILQRV
jgi:hypothetical protein